MPDIAEESVPDNGGAHGDVSYITLHLRDLQRFQTFFGDVLGLEFNVGQAGGAQITGPRPQIGVIADTDVPIAELCYRVDDLAAAVEQVRALGGTATNVAQRPYGLESHCADDQGTPFYLHQF